MPALQWTLPTLKRGLSSLRPCLLEHQDPGALCYELVLEKRFHKNGLNTNGVWVCLSGRMHGCLPHCVTIKS